MKSVLLALLTLLTCASLLSAQVPDTQNDVRLPDQPPCDSTPPAKLYKTKPLIELPVTALAWA